MQDYVVSYRLGKVINDIGDGTAEFYYNLISQANNNVYQDLGQRDRAGGDAERVLLRRLGSTQECTHEPGATATFSAPTCAPARYVPIITSYPRDAFGDLTPDLIEYQSSRDDFGGPAPSSIPAEVQRAIGGLLVGTGVLLPVGAAALMGVLVHKRGRDEWYAGLTPGLTPGYGEEAEIRRGGRPNVVVQFTPPEGVQPARRHDQDESADVVDVSARSSTSPCAAS